MRVSSFVEFTWDGSIVPKDKKRSAGPEIKSPFVTDVMAKRFGNMAERAHLLVVDQKIAKFWPKIVLKGEGATEYDTVFKNDYKGLPFDSENNVILIDHHKSIPDKLKRLSVELDVEEVVLLADTELLKLMLMRGWVSSLVAAVLRPGMCERKDDFVDVSEKRAAMEAQRYYVEMKNLLPEDLSEQSCQVIDQSLKDIRDRIARNLLVGPLRVNANLDFYGYKKTDRAFSARVTNQDGAGLTHESPVTVSEFVPVHPLR